MKVVKSIMVGLLSFLFLVACSNNIEDSNSDGENKSEIKKEDKENNQSTEPNTNDKVIDKVIDKSKEIESYNTSLDLGANLDHEEDEELNADVDYIKGNPPEIALTSFGVLRTVSKEGKTYYYNDEEWVDITDSVDLDTLYNVTYQEVVNTLKNISDELTTEESNGKKIFKYKGSNQNVYQALERLIHVNFGTVDVSKHETSLEFVVNQDDSVIENVHFNTEINDEEGEVTLEGDSDFSDFNNIDEIEWPKEIKEK